VFLAPPEMQVGTHDIDELDVVELRTAPEIPAEHPAIREHDDAAVRNVGLNPGADCRKELGVALVVDLGEGRKALRVAMDFDEGEPIGFRLLDQRLDVFRIPVDAVPRALAVLMRDQVDGPGDEAVTLRASCTPT